MAKIVFTRRDAGHCPQYKDFVIQDRYVGHDRFGHEAYDYALFRLKGFEPVRQFRTRRQGYQFLSRLTGLTQISVLYRNPDIICNDSECLGVVHGKIMYRFDKKTRVLQQRPLENERLSDWYDNYSDCLADAKRIVALSEKGEFA